MGTLRKLSILSAKISTAGFPYKSCHIWTSFFILRAIFSWIFKCKICKYFNDNGKIVSFIDKTKNSIKESHTLTNYQKKVKTVFVILLFWLLRHHIWKLPQCQNVLVCKWYLRVLSQLTHSFQQNIFYFDNFRAIYLKNLFDQYFHFTHCIQIWDSCPHT